MNRNTIVSNFARNFTNVANVVTTNVANVANVANVTESASKYGWILAVVGIFLLIGVMYLIKMYWGPTSPSEIISPPPLTALSSPAPDKESWCFVGEDLTGRYCVKVPAAGSCEPSRTYVSRNDCEMTPAHHLPTKVLSR